MQTHTTASKSEGKTSDNILVQLAISQHLAEQLDCLSISYLGVEAATKNARGSTVNRKSSYEELLGRIPADLPAEVENGRQLLQEARERAEKERREKLEKKAADIKKQYEEMVALGLID